MFGQDREDGWYPVCDGLVCHADRLSGDDCRPVPALTAAEEVAREAMRLASHKLPIKCKFVVKGKELGGDVNEG